jgi:hypothetical protein
MTVFPGKLIYQQKKIFDKKVFAFSIVKQIVHHNFYTV